METISGINLEALYVRSMNYAMLPHSSDTARRANVADALRYRAELERRAAAGDTRYARYARSQAPAA